MRIPVLLAALAAGCGLFPSLDGLGSPGDAGADGVVDAPLDVPELLDAVAECPVCTGTQTACGCSCVDVGADPLNCGACGHDCLGSTCTAGHCDPAAMTSNERPYDMAADQGHVFWTDQVNDVVVTCDVGNCPATRNVLYAGDSPEDITIDANNAYWTDNKGIAFQCARAGCGGSPIVLGSIPGQYFDGIAVTASTVFFAVDTVGIEACAIGGCGGSPTPVLSLTSPDELRIDQGTLYMVNYTSSSSGELLSCPVSSCTSTTTLATPLSDPDDVVVAGGNVYFGQTDGIYTCPSSGCAGAPVLFASAGAAPNDLATDGTTVYWTVPDEGIVASCPVSGCGQNAVLVMSGLTNPHGLAVDDQRVYGADTDGGRILWVAK
jgi:hypothetical protein